MKLSPFRTIAFCLGSAVIISGCSKSTNDVATPTPAHDMHVYGLNPMQPSDWQNVPVFSRNVLNMSSEGIPTITNPPANYLLISPEVRDQGQIGSCTGFCGTEANEIVEYENSTPASNSSINYSTGISTAAGFQIASTSQTDNSSALSPLFLYYVMRCIIEHQSITSDPGANMVNIGQALQGLSNNTGSGATTLTSSQRVKGVVTTATFAGESIETDYTYPWVSSSSGYNVATKSSGNYQTEPSAAAISNALNYDILSNPSGTSGSSGNTTGGYYLINSSTIIADVETAIASNKPVMMGFSVYDNKSYSYFENLSTTSYVYDPCDANGTLRSGLSLLGGHAVPIIGYITDGVPSGYGGGVFIVENSWGTPWGYHGYFYMPFNVLTNTKVVPAGNLYVIVK